MNFRPALALSLTLSAAWALPAVGEQTFGPATLGADLRLREVYVGNIGLDDQSPTANRAFQRFRLRGWAKYDFNEHVAANARLIWEGRHYNLPPASDWPFPGFETWYSGGILFDGLALDLKRIADSPLTIKAGRQDIRLGDGWLVLDGTPIDGSRTIYLDSARATYTFESQQTTLDLIYIDQYANTDRFPKPLNGVIEDQTEQFETGAILYARNKSLLKDTDLDGYFIYKGNDPNDTPGSIRVNNGAPFPSPADDGEVYTLGARIDAKVTPHWGLKAEAAGQWGDNSPYPGAPSQDISAFGLKARLSYALNDPIGEQRAPGSGVSLRRRPGYGEPTRPSTPCGDAGPSGASSLSTNGRWIAGSVRRPTCRGSTWAGRPRSTRPPRSSSTTTPSGPTRRACAPPASCATSARTGPSAGTCSPPGPRPSSTSSSPGTWSRNTWPRGTSMPTTAGTGPTSCGRSWR